MEPQASDPAVTREELRAREEIRTALRLGWTVAELRGRLRLGPQLILPAEPLPERSENDLPLFDERSLEEQRVEAQSVLVALADSCHVTRSVFSLTQGWNWSAYPSVPPPRPDEEATQYLVRLADALSEARKTGRDDRARECWLVIARLFYVLDMEIQNTLASRPFGRSSAYQLGRGLAETFWALDSKARGDEMAHPAFLLGDKRYTSLCMLINRLSFSMPPFTADALKESLKKWNRILSHHRRALGKEETRRLFAQMTVWRDLLLTGVDPLNLLPPTQGVITARRLLPVLRGFIWELVILGFGVAALAWAAFFFAIGGESAGALTGVLGGFGVTTAAVLARVKTTAQDLGNQLRRAMHRDLVTKAASVVPEPERGKGWLRLWARGRSE